MSRVTDDAPPLRTVVTADDPLVRRLIRDILPRENITVIAEAATGREAIEAAARMRELV
jgi:chemotaxis response regulator CheB